MEKELQKQNAMSVLDLNELKKIYLSAKVESELLEAGDVLPTNTLITYLKKDEKDRLISMSHTFIPLPQEVFPNIKLLQFYTELPFKGGEEIIQFLLDTNRQLPFGNFGRSESGEIYFRYVHVLPKYDTLNTHSDTLLNLINGILFILKINTSLIEEKCF